MCESFVAPGFASKLWLYAVVFFFCMRKNAKVCNLLLHVYMHSCTDIWRSTRHALAQHKPVRKCRHHSCRLFCCLLVHHGRKFVHVCRGRGLVKLDARALYKIAWYSWFVTRVWSAPVTNAVAIALMWVQCCGLACVWHNTNAYYHQSLLSLVWRQCGIKTTPSSSGLKHSWSLCGLTLVFGNHNITERDFWSS